MSLEQGGRTEKPTPFAAQATLQWRGHAHWGLGLDIGVGAGFQWLQEIVDPQFTLRHDFKGLLPLLTVYLGYSF